MSIFRRIFNFEKAKVEQLEKRQNQRYVPGQEFPLKATLHYAGRDLTASIQDVSSSGVGVLVNRDSGLAAGLHLRLDLTLAAHRLELEARIAHLQPQADGMYLGLGLIFREFEAQKSYLQLLQPVVIGQSLKPMVADPFLQGDTRYTKQAFIAEPDSQLTLWREATPDGPLHSFEFLMHDSFCRGTLRPGTAAPYALESREAAGSRAGAPVFETSGGLHEEIRQLYRWVLPNISSAVPADIRQFLQRFAG
ncbi:MAG TPA: PilZ domain-containing protein [Lacunisphaera sp.]|nr:PilZ domain-containing protein [Lacunisphaera sp.]